MAVDTRDKRAACLGLAGSWRGVLPLPTGTIGAGQRRMLVGNYPLTPVANYVWFRILDAVRNIVAGLPLAGAPPVYEKWLPRGEDGVDVFPLITVCPAGPENYEKMMSNAGAGLQGTDDIGIAILVAIVDKQNHDFTANLARNLNWRWQIISALRYQSLAGVPEVRICYPEPAFILDPGLFDANFFYSPMVFRFITRTVRGVV